MSTMPGHRIDQNRLLEMIATGRPLGETLDALCHLVEQMSPEWLASILLVDGEADSVWHGAAPTLPKGYVAAIDGTRAGPTYAPCGLAARGQPVVASDIAADTRWSSGYRELALQHGLRACRSTPIKASNGKVLGIFEIYSRQPGDPSAQQENRLEPFTHLASIAIERAQPMPADVGGEMLNALRRSEDRYARAMDASGDGHTEWIVASDEFFASSRFLEMCGLPPGATFAGRTDFSSRFPLHPDDRDRVLQAIDAHFAGQTVRLGMEMRILRHGETRWLRLTGVCLRDAAGTPVRWNAAVTDITDRKRAEEELRESEERFALAVAGANDGIWDRNLVTDRAFFSPRAQELLGLPADGVNIRPYAGWVGRVRYHPDDVAPREAAIRDHLEGRTPYHQGEWRVLHPDGTYRWIRSRGICTRDPAGRAVRFAGSITDIDAQKKAEEALQASEERYRAVVESQTELVCRYLPDTTLTFVNEAYCRFFGRRREELIGRRFVALIPESAWPAVLNQVASLVREPRVCRYEHEAMLADGTIRWQQWVDSPVVASDGRVTELQGIGYDITERKRAEDEVRLRKEELQRLMDSVSDYLWSAEVAVDGSFAYRYYSPVVERVTGRSPEYLMESPERWLDLVHPLDRPRLAEIFRRITSGATDREDAEYRIQRPDGALRWVRDSVHATRIEDGRILLHGVVGDITDRKLAAEALRESEARFRSLTEISSDWYWRQDENLRFTYLSSQAPALTGYSGESSIGKTRWEIANMTPLSCSWPEHQAVLAARQPFRDLECRRVGPDGTVRYLSMSGAPIFDEQGRFTGYQGVGRSITERKRAEEALRQSEERFALAVAGANEGIFDWDLVTDRVYVSHRAQELFGLPRGELWQPRREWRNILAFHSDDVKHLHDGIKALIAGETPTYDVEFRIILPDGSIRWFRQRGIALRDASGKAYRMVGSIGDITDRKRAEEELLRVERQLRQAQRLEAMGTLAGGIAHDFNNILGAILGYGEMALRDVAKGSRLRRDLDSIMTAGERGRALVERILAFSRSSVDERVAVHVERVAREALDQLAAKLPADVTIAPRLRAGRAAVLGDATQVHQVLMNLATNAVQAMPSGGTLRVRLEAARVDERRVATTGTVEAGDYVVLEVADAGVGIQPDILERIFDPFFTTREVGVGTGLGLSLVHSIVTELGGAINVASAPGAGSTFTVYLPRAGDAIEVSESEMPDLPRGNDERVLVVDDEEPLVRIATETLTELGYRPVGFTSSSAALEAFRADPLGFDAVITDERMPGMSGSTLIREVRGIRAGIPTMLMSGYLGGTVSVRAREAGADELLQKPLSGRELATSLARVLQTQQPVLR